MEISKTIIQFEYTPSDFLESQFTHSEQNYVITIENGISEITIPGSTQMPTDTFISEIKQKVIAILNARMLLNHSMYKLDTHKIDIYFPDGSKTSHYIMEASSGEIVFKGFAPDILIKDAQGNVIRDTKAERLVAESNVLRLFAQVGDRNPLLKAMINSYTAAVQDPNDELVHLYEIIDALKSHFRTKINVLSQLDFDETRWDRLHSLSNNEPLLEGRHRGSKASLRKAEESELEEARQIAKSLILSYASHLKKKNYG